MARVTDDRRELFNPPMILRRLFTRAVDLLSDSLAVGARRPGEFEQRQAHDGGERVGSAGPAMCGGERDALIWSGLITLMSGYRVADSCRATLASRNTPNHFNEFTVVAGKHEDLVGSGGIFPASEILAQPVSGR